MQERQEFLDRYFVFSDKQDYNPPHDYSRTYGLLEDIREGYISIEEAKIIDEASSPKDVKGHEPGQPLEMPATIHMTAAAAPATSAPPVEEKASGGDKADAPRQPRAGSPLRAQPQRSRPQPRAV